MNKAAKYGSIVKHMKNYMNEAFKEAEKAKAIGEVPVGAVIVKNGEILGRGHNMTISLKDPTAHGEIIAIRQAAEKLGGHRLVGCTMHVTLEPCAMCAGALVLARIERLYIGTMDPKSGACGSVMNILKQDKLNHEVQVEGYMMQEDCERILKDFFKNLRKGK